MAYINDRWLNRTGLNLIRIVIGSYFMAASLDLVTGLDQAVMFRPFLTAPVADLTGSALLFAFSVTFMTGIALRLNALMLTLFVFCSSLVQTFLTHNGDISGFWRDLALCSAVLMTYSGMGKREIRHAAILKPRQKPAPKITDHVQIIPRRIAKEKADIVPAQKEIRSALSATIFQKQKVKPGQQQQDVVNIFTDV